MAFSNNHTLISRGTKVVGDLHFTGDLQIEGHVCGNIMAESGNDAKLVVAEKGVVEGEIRVPMVIINGNVHGNVHSSKHVELASKAVVEGNVHYQLIEMVKGAQVNGSLVYSGPSSAQKGAETPKASERLKTSEDADDKGSKSFSVNT
ncbi:polymer-forming cytoskeletal protein [Marinimicrobium sp. ABcell2]|uniref:bactofilin family protein n=1 Tax=Marinimicrobium sp. ABcell2 TaxID=3069751 RepID=UPI0027B52EB1|nr:polymer-forming cytoskeletal protein [Marinimicrobium sp. ABcell2]MDQ2075719.1 polymer-forming cytoskeletal protein [Marinimicrobium sp. ABcell2]